MARGTPPVYRLTVRSPSKSTRRIYGLLKVKSKRGGAAEIAGLTINHVIEAYIPTHSVWLASMTNPVGQEQFDSVGLAAVSKHKEVQFLTLQGLATAIII